jgi:hypothetical protein
MRATRVMATLFLSIGAAAVAPPAHAYDGGLPMNGTFAVTSIGDWAKTDDVYRDEASMQQTWQVTSQCDNPQSCTGHVVSDAGWNAELTYHTDRWLVHNQIPDWEKCPDGTAFPGDQLFRFYPIDAASGRVEVGSTTYAGEDITTGLTGKCGVSTPLVIRMPVRIDKIA